EKNESTFNSFNDDTFLELGRALKGSFGTSTEKAKVDPLNAQQTMEITERKKLECEIVKPYYKKSNIESRIRAARAAKKALLENGNNSKIGDNLTFLRELEKMCQYSRNPLEKIGLRLKEEYYYGYEYSDDGNGIISDELEDDGNNSKIGDNLTFLRELEKMCQYSRNPLEKIGLRLKEEYYYGYEYSDDGNGIISDELEDVTWSMGPCSLLYQICGFLEHYAHGWVNFLNCTCYLDHVDIGAGYFHDSASGCVTQPSNWILMMQIILNCSAGYERIGHILIMGAVYLKIQYKRLMGDGLFEDSVYADMLSQYVLSLLGIFLLLFDDVE
nr:hypothetical protein [Tanacetum cinerariifolium]